MIFRIVAETESNKELRKISFRSMIAELPNLLLILGSAIMSHSLIVWVDVLGSLGGELHSAIIYFITRKISKVAGKSYRFNVERLEVMASFTGELLMIFGYLALLVTAIYQIFNPKPINNTGIIVYLVVKSIDIIVDGYFYIRQKKLYKKHQSKVNETEATNWRNNLLIDGVIATLSVVLVAFAQSGWSAYVSPIATLILSIGFIRGCIKRIKGSTNDLIEAAVSVPKQDEIIDILLEHRSHHIEKIEDVKCYYLNYKLNITLKIIFTKDTIYQEEVDLLEEWQKAVEEVYPDSNVSIEIGN